MYPRPPSPSQSKDRKMLVFKQKGFDPYWLAVTFLIAIIVLALYLAERDQIKDAEHYCHQVRSGEWPDYREDYATECLQTYGPATPVKPR